MIRKILSDIGKKICFLPVSHHISTVGTDDEGIHQCHLLIQSQHLFQVRHRRSGDDRPACLAIPHGILGIDQHTQHLLTLRARSGKYAEAAVIQHIPESDLTVIFHSRAIDRLALPILCIESQIDKIPHLRTQCQLVKHVLVIRHRLGRMSLDDTI